MRSACPGGPGAGPQFVWQGQVDGIAILHLRGKNLAVQIQQGDPVQRQQFHFSDALPDTGQNVRLEVLEGRGSVRVTDQPNIENHYSLSVAIEDRQPGSAFYSIALYWDTSNNGYDRGAAKTDKVSWTGRVVHAAVIIAGRIPACPLGSKAVRSTARRWRTNISSFQSRCRIAIPRSGWKLWTGAARSG